MADRDETVKWAKNGLNYLRIEVGEVVVTLNDTVTLDSFDDATALMGAYLMKKVDGTEMSSTIADNELTVTEAGTDVPCWYMAYGYVPK